MKHVTKTIDELLATGESPLPLEVIPNYMGINLVSVHSLSWVKQSDGQLSQLTINFVPTLKDEIYNPKRTDWIEP